MPNNVTIYHNPRCSKSRAAVELLKTREIDFTVVEYLKQPPDKKTITAILTLLDMHPAQLMRSGEKTYKELGLNKGDHTPAELIQAMVDHPILIERPIVTTNDGAAIGRPIENIIELIDDL